MPSWGHFQLAGKIARYKKVKFLHGICSQRPCTSHCSSVTKVVLNLRTKAVFHKSATWPSSSPQPAQPVTHDQFQQEQPLGGTRAPSPPCPRKRLILSKMLRSDNLHIVLYALFALENFGITGNTSTCCTIQWMQPFFKMLASFSLLF